jgi:SAM-dependent methyltransferase
VHGELRGVAAWWEARRLFLPRERRPEAAYAALRGACVRLRRRMPGGRRVYEGEDRLRPGALLLCNHESPADAMLLLALRVPVRFAGDAAALRGPLPGRLVREAGLFVAAEDVPARLAAGDCVAILDGGQADRGVLAVALVNTRSVMSADGWWIDDHDAIVSILGPVDGLARAREAVEDAGKRLRIRTQTGPRWHRAVAGLYRYLGPTTSHYAASKTRRDPLVRALPELCAGAEHILVAGCGFGIATSRLALADPARPMLAVDSDERKVAVASAALGGYGTVTFRVGDIRDVDLGSPDLAVAVDLLHYWPDDTQRRILERIVRALRPGGRLLFRDGCSDDRGHALVVAGERFAGLIGFTRTGPRFHFRSRAGWCSLLAECGLLVLHASPELGALSNTVLMCEKR